MGKTPLSVVSWLRFFKQRSLTAPIQNNNIQPPRGCFYLMPHPALQTRLLTFIPFGIKYKEYQPLKKIGTLNHPYNGLKAQIILAQWQAKRRLG
jgi:hypothetical protein